MATPIREALFDENDTVIPHVYNRIRNALYALGGCPTLIKRGKRKGEKCGHRIEFCAYSPQCMVIRCRFHSREPYEEPFGKIVFGVLDELRNEEEKKYQEQNRPKLEAYAKKQALKELGEHGITFTDPPFHLRPQGKALSGKTWSYLRGGWYDPKWLKKNPYQMPTQLQQEVN